MLTFNHKFKMKKIFTFLLIFGFNTAFCQSFNDVFKLLATSDEKNLRHFLHDNNFTLTPHEYRENYLEIWKKDNFFNKEGLILFFMNDKISTIVFYFDDIKILNEFNNFKKTYKNTPKYWGYLHDYEKKYNYIVDFESTSYNDHTELYSGTTLYGTKYKYEVRIRTIQQNQ